MTVRRVIVDARPAALGHGGGEARHPLCRLAVESFDLGARDTLIVLIGVGVDVIVLPGDGAAERDVTARQEIRVAMHIKDDGMGGAGVLRAAERGHWVAA